MTEQTTTLAEIRAMADRGEITGNPSAPEGEPLPEGFWQEAKVFDRGAFHKRVSRSYCARVRVVGYATITVEADSQEEAVAKVGEAIDAMWDDNGDLIELDEIDDIDTRPRVRKEPDMYLVTRDGRPMRVSHLQPGDEPRQPDERGF
ncbi:hypothetical protein DWF04_005890 [Cereibacter sphaeroides f. sp. denitrificans]|nr:hypothetical protein DWF04_06295 [Cereibacter sphaeroides f. sp. denitrificans]